MMWGDRLEGRTLDPGSDGGTISTDMVRILLGGAIRAGHQGDSGLGEDDITTVVMPCNIQP
jgi:hypothetical protein